jgi:phosphoglycolate phosphatase-like HAD superfamily hydrolase
VHTPSHDFDEKAGLLAKAAARLGAPEQGVLAGPSVDDLLERVLAGCQPSRVILAGSLQPHWAPRLDTLGLPWAALVLEGRGALDILMDAVADPEPDTQVWLNLDRIPSLDFMDLLSLDAFLAFAASRPVPPLVVLMRDDAPSLGRTQRLAVDRLGNVLLVRETLDGAYALGRPAVLDAMAGGSGRAPLPTLTQRRGRRHLLVLDVDGVLIDPGRAFTEAVAGALAELEPGLAWDDHLYAALKRQGSFNNDFRLTAGALALAEAGALSGLETAPAGSFSHLEARIQALEPLCQAMVQKQYARTRWLERPLVKRQDLDSFKGDMAIYTGRPPEELAMAFEVLGFRLPAVADRGPHLRKPRPEGLIQLADSYRAGQITFVGDTCDDAAALASARALRPDLAWTFAAVGPDRARFAQPGDLMAASLIELLPRLDARSHP